MTKVNIPNVPIPTPTQKKPRWLLYLVLVVAFILFWIGIKSYRSIDITKGKWQLYWQNASEEKIYGVFRAKIEKISPDYILLSFLGAAGKMEGKSTDGQFYEGTWNDPRPKKGGIGKWNFRFVSKNLAIGLFSDMAENKKSVIALQKLQNK